VTSDGLDRHWFVARDYLAFLASARTFAPAGGTSMNDVFLTDGFGRTLYVCLEDLARTPEREAISSCDDTCAIKRPVFTAPETGRPSILPSVINASDVGQLMRLDGSLQLMYRGWPLYYFSGDITAGSTEGHNDEAWRAIDPITFGIEPAPGPSN
jgi:predicted lipoprotein with Yx(FWY)xxD motif